jgi:hypothetical protein
LKSLVLNAVGTGPSTPPKVPLRQNSFQHLKRFRNEYGGIGTIGGGFESIAPQSEYVYFFPDQFSQEQYESMIRGQRSLMLTGICEYCDALGNYTCRKFTLFWQGPPFNTFSKIAEMNCAWEYGYPPIPARGQRYLLPCEQPDEREKREKQERKEMLKKAASPPQGPPSPETPKSK